MRPARIMAAMQSYFIEFESPDLLRVVGKDSEKLLQGQLTCDLSALPEIGACPGCLCDIKGRVIASFTLYRLNDEYYLEMSSGLGQTVESTLKKYAVFYDTEIESVSGRFQYLGLAGPDARQVLTSLVEQIPEENNAVIQQQGIVLRLVDHKQDRYSLWLENEKAEKAEALISRLKQSLTRGNTRDWTLADMTRGVYTFQPEDQGLFTPQELNYDLQGHISFTKGCYTGQEIVARMHYRGKAKKRLYQLQISSPSEPARQVKIINESGKAIGEVISVLNTDENSFAALAVCSKDADEIYSLEDIPDSRVIFRN